MNAKELFEFLTNDAGLDQATVQTIMAAAANEKVGAKAGTLKQQSEYDAIQQKMAALQADYEGSTDKPGAKAYREWYQSNFPKIQSLQQQVSRYQERYGALDDAGAPGTGAPVAPAAASGGTVNLSKEQIAQIVNETIQTQYGPRWSNLLTDTGTIVQRHMRAGRKTEIDFKKLGELAEAKGGNLMAAYEEWDRPEAEATQKAQTEAEINRRVKEEVARRQTQAAFPAGADATPSGSAGITRAAGEKKYDRSKVVETAVTGKYDGGQQSAA